MVVGEPRQEGPNLAIDARESPNGRPGRLSGGIGLTRAQASPPNNRDLGLVGKPPNPTRPTPPDRGRPGAGAYQLLAWGGRGGQEDLARARWPPLTSPSVLDLPYWPDGICHKARVEEALMHALMRK